MSQTYSLPSSDAAGRFLDGDRSAAVGILTSTLGRAALIGVGLYAAGERDRKKLVERSVASALVVEIFVFCYLWSKRKSP